MPVTLVLSNDEVSGLLAMPECIEVLEQVYSELARGLCLSRTTSECMAPSKRPDAVYALKSMDGVIPSLGVGSVRINSDLLTAPSEGGRMRRVKVPAAPNNRYVGLVFLFSSETGEPLAIFPDGVVQRFRVGATNALGAKYLARDDSSSVAILGSGWQAETQLTGVCTVRSIDTVRCYSPNRERREAFAARMSRQLDMAVTAVDAPEQAVAGADIVLCASNALDPIFFAPWVEPGMHLSSIKRPEIEPKALRRVDRLVVHTHDKGSTVLTTADLQDPEKAAGKGRAAAEEIDFQTLPCLADLVSGGTAGRRSDEEVTCLVNHMGLGLQFAAVGAVVYRKAKAKGIGHDLPTDWFTEKEHP